MQVFGAPLRLQHFWIVNEKLIWWGSEARVRAGRGRGVHGNSELLYMMRFQLVLTLLPYRRLPVSRGTEHWGEEAGYLWQSNSQEEDRKNRRAKSQYSHQSLIPPDNNVIYLVSEHSICTLSILRYLCVRFWLGFTNTRHAEQKLNKQKSTLRTHQRLTSTDTENPVFKAHQHFSLALSRHLEMGRERSSHRRLPPSNKSIICAALSHFKPEKYTLHCCL